MRLLNPTDDELNAAFAEKVAGWRCHPDVPEDRKVGAIMCWIPPRCQDWQMRERPNFITSADAVLPWLEKWPHGFEIERVYSERYAIRVMAGKYTGGVTRPVFWAEEKTFPRSCVIALLRAHGVEVEFT